MRLPRVRFTLRRMMGAVILVGVGLGLSVWMDRRAERFRALGADHIRKVGVVSSPDPWPYEVRAIYHLTMAKKYRAAALRPWLPVEPDPPPPEP
jgi:hypothetical protein